MRSAVEKRKNKRPPETATQTNPQAQIAAGTGNRAGMRSEAHAQTQTEMECLVGEGGADPAAALGWRPLPPQDTACDTRDGAERLAETMVRFTVEAGVASRRTGALASDCSSPTERVRAPSGHVGKSGFHGAVPDPLARRDDTCREEFYSCEGSEPEGRSNGSAVTNAVEQKPRKLSDDSRIGVTLGHRFEKDATGTSATRTNQGMAGVGGSPGGREVVILNNDERNRGEGSGNTSESSEKHGGAEAGLASVLLPWETATLRAHTTPPRQDQLEGSSNAWTGKEGAGEACRSERPFLEQAVGQASLSPALSRAVETNLLMDENVEANHVSHEESPVEYKADDIKREDEQRTDTSARTGKELDDGTKNDAEV